MKKLNVYELLYHLMPLLRAAGWSVGLTGSSFKMYRKAFDGTEEGYEVAL